MWILEKYRPVWAPEGSSGGSSAPASGSSGGSGGAPSSGTSTPSSAPSSPSGGGSSRASTTAPAESPASAGEAQPSTPSSDSDLSFETIFGHEGSPSEFEGEAPPAAPPSVPTQPAAPPPAAAAPVAEVPAVPGSAPVEAAAAQVAPGASPPPPASQEIDPYNPGQLAQHLLGVEAQATQFVAEQMFQLSPEDKEAIETDVIGTIPKLLAKVFVKSQQNVLQQLDRLIPVMVQRHTQAMKRNSEGEDKFYTRWPNIGREHGDLVNRYASVYRQMHPTATLDQMIEDVGPMIMMAARIAPPSVGGPENGQAPRQAPVGANGRPPQPAPFVPAGSGAGPASQPKTQELNPWEAMFVGRDQ